MNLRSFGLLPLLAGLLALWGLVPPEGASQAPASNPSGDSDVRHCTILTVSRGNRVFFGGNDDYFNRDSTYWVSSRHATRYGVIFFGKPDNVQQGFNEKGLAYDANGVAEAPVTFHPGRKPVHGGYSSYPIQILQECATVEEVIAWVQDHQWHQVMHDQLHFADATGDAVVISAGRDGQVAFTRKPAGDGFLISTNFNLANLPTLRRNPCWRYRRAEEMLGKILGQDELTAERVASIMEAVHVEGPSGWTIYSLVADLRQRLVYVYFMFQYDAPIVLSIDEELATPQSSRPLSELFPEETQQRADQAYERLVARSARCDLAGFVWLGTVALSLAALLLLTRTRGRSLAFWLPVVAVLGPAGLLGWLIVTRGRRPRALVETVGDLAPCVAGTVAALFPLAFVPAIGQNSGLLLALYGLPLIIGLFLYQAPLLAWATGSNYARTVLRRLPAVLVSTNLALAGLLAIGLPLIDRHANYCGLSSFTLLQWWPIAVLGALVGGLLLYVYHAWAIHRGTATGTAAWSALLWGTADAGDAPTTASYPSWRRLWLWLVLSYLLLAAGIVLGVMGTSPA